MLTVMEPTVAVDVENVSMQFGATTALDDVTFSVQRGTVHSLLGRNGAGKSTLVGILAGLRAPTSGEIRFAEDITSVGTVFQHSMLVPHLSVTENLGLGMLPRRAGRIDWRGARKEARALLDAWDLDVRVDTPVESLSVAERQLVEIIREFSRGAKFVVLDEPTSRLEGADIARLHDRVRRARDAGITFIYISHHLAEVMELCDAATTLRDGRIVSTRLIAETTSDTLIHDMVGEDMPDRQRSVQRRTTSPAGPVLELRRLTAGSAEISDVMVKSGEMVGIAGLVGSGKEAIAESLAGLAPAEIIDASVMGSPVRCDTPGRAIASGIACVPGDRHREGLVLHLPVGENMTMSIASRLANSLGLLSPRARDRRAQELSNEVGLKAASVRQEAESLSGGNQQKAVLARALASSPNLLVLINPTTGVDVASKAVIYDVIAQRQAEGAAVLLVTDELEEYERCDRVLVLFEGKVTRQFDGTWDQSELLAAIEGVSA
jgi:simple sugar transport system ATP-binding protein